MFPELTSGTVETVEIFVEQIVAEDVADEDAKKSTSGRRIQCEGTKDRLPRRWKEDSQTPASQT